MKEATIHVSKDTPALFFTSVTKDRLPVFKAEVIKDIACRALAEARISGSFALFAYVIMLDHIHWITDAARKPSDILKFVDGIMSHRVIQYLKDNSYRQSLDKLKGARKQRGYEYSLWDHHPNTLWLTNESMLMQKVNYIHQNPVKSGMVDRAEEYLWSSVRWWTGNVRPDEPIKVDIEMISWQKRRS